MVSFVCSSDIHALEKHALRRPRETYRFDSIRFRLMDVNGPAHTGLDSCRAWIRTVCSQPCGPPSRTRATCCAQTLSRSLSRGKASHELLVLRRVRMKGGDVNSLFNCGMCRDCLMKEMPEMEGPYVKVPKVF